MPERYNSVVRLHPVTTLGLAGLLLLPFAFVTRAAASLVDPVSTRVASVLSGLAQGLGVPAISQEAEHEESTDFASSTVAHFTVVAASGTQPARRMLPVVKQPYNVFVSASSVLRLAESAARPQGSFVQKTLQRPAGLRLSGVNLLGIGLEEGDILIEALGLPAQSSGAIVGAIIAARAEKARHLVGKVWRRGQTFQITVEQPY